jgi:hypothetical protein
MQRHLPMPATDISQTRFRKDSVEERTQQGREQKAAQTGSFHSDLLD